MKRFFDYRLKSQQYNCAWLCALMSGLGAVTVILMACLAININIADVAHAQSNEDELLQSDKIILDEGEIQSDVNIQSVGPAEYNPKFDFGTAVRRYQGVVSFSFLDMAMFDFSIENDESDSENVQIKAKSFGPISWFYPFEFSMFARRFAENDRSLLTESNWKSEDYRTHMEWQSGEPILLEKTRPEQHARVKIDPQLIVDSSDPVFVWVDLGRQLAQGGSCNYKADVYDGTRKYLIISEELEREVITTDARKWSYRGPAVKCQFFQVKQGGYLTEEGYEELGYEPSKEEDIVRYIWWAPLDSELWLPVYAEIETPIVDAKVRIVFNQELFNDNSE